MLLASHLRRSRHGIYYFRLILPAPIAAVLGQRELVRSLGIRSPKLARFSGYQISLRLTPILERLQRIMAIDPNSISPKDIKKLVVEGLDFRRDGSMGVERLITHNDPKIAEQEMETVRKTALAWRSVHDFTANLSDDEFAKRKAEAMRMRDEMMAMTAAPKPPAAPAPMAVAGVTIPLRPSTLKQCYDAYIATKKKISESAKTAYKGSFELFAKLSGGADRMAHEITEVEFMEFNDALAFVPAHATKRGIELKRAADMIENPPLGKDKAGNPVEFDTISGNTANLHCTNLQGFFDYVINSGRRNGDNPFAKLPRHSDGEEIGGADGFDEHELRAIFKPESLMQAKRPSQFWTPLLALYTGARLNELACLELTDFVEEKGVPCISIRYVPRAKPNTIEHNTKKKAARSVKTASSIRLVPLHPDLYEIGIEAYMDDVRAIGATRFFPTLPPDTKGKRERRLSHDGNTYLKKVEVHVPRKKVMHSFRDTVCEMLAVPDMDDVRADQWTGHATQSVKGRHYRRSKAAIELQAKEGFGALNFPFIDIEALQYRPEWFDEYNKANMVP
jgi:integrase